MIFRGVSAKDAVQHLEMLRKVIEVSSFRLRGTDRRAIRSAEKTSDRRVAGESDRRRPAKKKIASNSVLSQPPDGLSVTVSIGVAEPGTRYRQPEQVINAADQALYRAKQRGRNRVEMASTAPLRLERTKRVKASRS